MMTEEALGNTSQIDPQPKVEDDGVGMGEKMSFGDYSEHLFPRDLECRVRSVFSNAIIIPNRSPIHPVLVKNNINTFD